MTIKVRDAGNTLRSIQVLKVRDAGGVLRNIQTVRVRDAGNVSRLVFSAMSATITPAAGVAQSASNVAGYYPWSMTTLPATAAPTGGVGPYTYAWTKVSGPAGITAVTPSAASTRFTTTFAAAGVLDTVWKCTITDNNGTTASDQCQVYMAASD